jgi:uncharacterized membrane protein YoaK (UPF0700 family)
MDASLSRDLALGTVAVLLGGQLTWWGARLCVRATRVPPRRAKSVQRLIMVQFDLVVVCLLALVSVTKVQVAGPAEEVISRFGAAVLGVALVHAMVLLYLVSRALHRDVDPVSYDHIAYAPTIPTSYDPSSYDPSTYGGVLNAGVPAYPPNNTADGVVTVLMILTGLSGFIDAATYLGIGRFFLGKMTGNVEHIGWAVARVPGFLVTEAVAALAAFLVGAVAAGRLSRLLQHRRQRWMAAALVVEAGLLLIALIGVVAARSDSPTSSKVWLIELLALAMGFRNGTTRKLAEPDMTTTLITGNLADIGADCALAGGNSPRLRRRLGSVVSMLGGAAIGGFLYAHHGLIAPLALAATVACVLAVGYPLFLVVRAAVEYLRPAAGMVQDWIEHQRNETRSLDERVRRLEESMSHDQRRDR